MSCFITGCMGDCPCTCTVEKEDVAKAADLPSFLLPVFKCSCGDVKKSATKMFFCFLCSSFCHEDCCELLGEPLEGLPQLLNVDCFHALDEPSEACKTLQPTFVMCNVCIKAHPFIKGYYCAASSGFLSPCCLQKYKLVDIHKCFDCQKSVHHQCSVYLDKVELVGADGMYPSCWKKVS